jgi:glycosyltransferase involved in cell wall biosynthesis
MHNTKRVWIAWEQHRRSLELAKVFNCRYYSLEYEGPMRYAKCFYKTILILVSERPTTLIVQNPSMVLAALAALYKLAFRKKILVVDRHTNFRLGKKNIFSFSHLIFMLLHQFTIRVADITIVTNTYLANLVRKLKGAPFVLPDVLPNITPTRKDGLSECFNILLISSFAEDEPIKEVLKAVENSAGMTLYVSGKFEKLDKEIVTEAPKNVIFTGFLNDEQYINLLFEVDAAMALTTAEFCMLCGCYEAVAAEKPLITSNKSVLLEYFSGSIFVDNSSKSISDAFKKLIIDFKMQKSCIIDLKKRILVEERIRIDNLENHLSRLEESYMS